MFKLLVLKSEQERDLEQETSMLQKKQISCKRNKIVAQKIKLIIRRAMIVIKQELWICNIFIDIMKRVQSRLNYSSLLGHLSN